MRYFLVLMTLLTLLSCSSESIDPAPITDSPPMTGSEPITDPQERALIYYVSETGDNENDGLTIETAWRSVEPINNMEVQPNTTFMFKGTFESLVFGADDNGAVITSYKDTRAQLKGITILNTSNFIIKNIDIKQEGIKIENSLSDDTKISNFVISDVEVSNAWIGILMYSHHDTSGIADVTIDNVKVYDCTEGGIYSQGYFNKNKVGYSHSNIHISNSEVYNISGWDNKYSHSGNGIMLSDVQYSSIVDTKAYNNGSENTKCGGNVGIWYWDSKDVLIQGCESYNNKSLGCDGAGFDFDGGVVNGIMQYNYSHDNYGGGFLVGQFPGSRRMENITVRYNISVNDNITNGGSIYLFDYSGVNDSMQDIFIYNNTLVQDTRLTFKSLHNFSNDNVIVINNIFNGKLTNSDRVTFLSNHVGRVDFVNGYKLSLNSNLINAATNLDWEIGDRDFYGNPSLTGEFQDFGAFEFVDKT
ncbi:hypothetical protein BXY82_1405 [Gelidibacter sediminis]|uniref:Parallel beta helix pectate lyase-like protein n=1 Tax=Gelidibacter sediminis TaxID=1608710 RepID=A0A4R7PZ05_9FLAO|nr:right-handed parallel beta-helix repeat-containing protein [Gelidibacter sediminis]TDU39381.1 hypothetical protein BXY82_1405 [Gelidibacter sediminis]